MVRIWGPEIQMCVRKSSVLETDTKDALGEDEDLTN